ncbi:MAG: hypothetical protein AAGE52_20670, partial [Myxococcota bacterium]
TVLFAGTAVASFSAKSMTPETPWLALSNLPEELRRSALSYASFQEMWTDCERPDWLVAMAVVAGVDRVKIVAVVCDCIERARGDLPMPEAWTLAKNWSRGQTDGRTTWAAGFRAASEAREMKHAAQRQLMEACAAAAFACDEEADEGYYASRAHAAEAARLATLIAGEKCAEMAAVVRRRIEGAVVQDGLESLARRDTTPPPEKPRSGEWDTARPRPVTPRTLFRIRR